MERSLQNTSEELKSKLANERSRQAEEAKMIDRMLVFPLPLFPISSTFCSILRLGSARARGVR